MDEYKPINVHGILLTAVHDGGTGEEQYFPDESLFYCLPNTAETITGVVSLVYYLHCATDKYIPVCMTEPTAKIRPCERKKMQFILIEKLANISIKLVA